MMPDWWSVGIILYEMMCKRKPFDLPKMTNVEGLEDKKWADAQSKLNNERICTMEIEFDQKANCYSTELKNLVM